jgi:PAS domain S-box-containing protein
MTRSSWLVWEVTTVQHVPEQPDATTLLVAIVENSDDAIISKDLNSNITSWNRAAERLFGYASEEALGCPINMIIPADRQQEETMILERIRAGRRVEHFETVRRRKHGSLIDVSLTVSPVRNAQGKIIGASKIARDITERKRAHQRQLFLVRELQHRTQNLFVVIQSVINQTLVGGLSLATAKGALNGRIQALADAHSILADHAWDGGPLTDIIGRLLASFSNQLSVRGCDMTVNTQAAQHFALTIHELATNAVKYGAFSVPTGSVSIKCDVERSVGTFSFLWKESGGPIVMSPERKGFGTTILIDSAKGFSQHVALDYEPDGLKYEVRFPLSSIEARSQNLTR